MHTYIIIRITRAPLRGRLTPPLRSRKARKNATKNIDYVKGAERRGPRFGANSDLIMPRAACAEQIALLVVLSCAVCFCYRCYVLIASMGVISALRCAAGLC